MERWVVINIRSLPLFSPIVFKDNDTNEDKNGVILLMTKPDHNTVQKSVLVDIQDDFIGNPYKLDNIHDTLTGDEQMILLLGVQVSLYKSQTWQSYVIKYFLIHVINVILTFSLM